MPNKFYDVLNAAFSRVKSDLQAVSSIKSVFLGEDFRLGELPMAVINPEVSGIRQAASAELLECHINFTVVLIVRETEPANWFTDVLSPMGDILDKLLTDRTLNGLVLDLTPSLFSPGEIRTQSKLYYGGIIRFDALLQFTP